MSNPYPGLRPFEESDSRFFFGRDTQVDELLERLARSRFVGVVGSSASGKSSLVRAGLLPALHGGFMAGQGSRWRIVVMRPGNAPIANLAAALDDAGIPEHREPELAVRIGLTRAVLQSGSLGLVEVAGQGRQRTDESILVVVDQFEELFRYKQDRDEAAAFLKLLLAAAAERTVPIYVLLTMRSDFLGECSQFRDLPETISSGLFLVPRLTRDQLREAIEGPAAIVETEISPALVNRLLNELDNSQEQLPVLQHALMRTWDVWHAQGARGLAIDERDLKAAGGLERALSIHGDDIYDKLRPGLQPVAEKVFRALTDRTSDERGTRRPTRFADLVAIVGASASDVLEVVESFRAPGQSFLTPAPPKPITDATVIDISHESLMRIWGRLRAWSEAEAASAQTYRRISDAATLYARNEGTLLIDPALAIAATWRVENQPTPAWAERYATGFEEGMRFLEASVADRARRDKATRAASRRRVRLMGAAIAVLFLLSLASILALIYGERQRSQGLIAQSRFLARDAQADVDGGDALLGMLVALSALPNDLNHPDRPFVQDAEYALENAVANLHERMDLIGHSGPVNSAAFSPDGRRIVTASSDKTVRIWDASTGTQLRVLRHEGAVNSAAFSPDGRRILSGSADSTVRLWDATSGERQRVLFGDGPVRSALFSPDGRRILMTSGIVGTISVLNTAGGGRVRIGGDAVSANSAAYSPDGRRIVVASQDGTALVWGAAGGLPLRVLRGHDAAVLSAAFSPDGRRIVTASEDGTARTWAAVGGAAIRILRGHSGPVNSALFSPDGKRIVTTSDDRTSRIWDAADGAQIYVFRDSDAVNSAAFSPDGEHIVSASGDRTARIWDTAAHAQVGVLHGSRDGFTRAEFSPDGRRIATSAFDKTARIWDAGTSTQVRVLHGHTGFVNSVAFSPDGRRIVTASDDRTARIWDAGSGAQIRVLRGHGDKVESAVFSPDGRRVVTASYDRTARIWDAASGEPIRVLRGHKDFVVSAAFSPDGRRVVTASVDRTARIWDAATGAQIRVLRGHEVNVVSAAFSPDGRSIVTASFDATARIWNAASGAQLRVLHSDAEFVLSAAFSPDGRRIVTASDDRTARIWDVSTGAQISVLRGHDGFVDSAAFSPDGRSIVTASDDGTARIWAQPRCQELIDEASRLTKSINRQLSAPEREQEFLTAEQWGPPVALHLGNETCR